MPFQFLKVISSCNLKSMLFGSEMTKASMRIQEKLLFQRSLRNSCSRSVHKAVIGQWKRHKQIECLLPSQERHQLSYPKCKVPHGLACFTVQASLTSGVAWTESSLERKAGFGEKQELQDSLDATKREQNKPGNCVNLYFSQNPNYHNAEFF